MPSWFSRAAKRLPDPTGPFSVGCTDFMCNASSTDDVGGKGSFLRLFYPAELPEKLTEHEQLHRQAHWFPKSHYSWGLLGFLKFPRWLGAILNWTIGHVRIPAIMNLPLIGSEKHDSSLPCVVFSHGLGGNRLMYATYCCELASHGCMVAMVEHRDLSACATYVLKKDKNGENLEEEWLSFYHRVPDDEEFKLRNSQVTQRSEECVSALNILERLQEGTAPENLLKAHSMDLSVFKDRLDTKSTAIVGHSFGGATTIATLARDTRFKCGVVLDVWMLPLGKDISQQQIQQPVFFINTYQFHHWKDNIDELKKLIDAKPETRPIIAISKTSHVSQCDIPFLFGRYLTSFSAWKSDHLDPTTADSLYKKGIWAFLCRHLGIGNPPEHEPIIDGGDDVPDHVIIGIDDKDSKL